MHILAYLKRYIHISPLWISLYISKQSLDGGVNTNTPDPGHRTRDPGPRTPNPGEKTIHISSLWISLSSFLSFYYVVNKRYTHKSSMENLSYFIELLYYTFKKEYAHEPFLDPMVYFSALNTPGKDASFIISQTFNDISKMNIHISHLWTSWSVSSSFN